jgi:hypothetical protein
MHAMHIYQIHYGLEDERDSGFDVLDNASNERPDWFEYWPIRKYLLGETLDENAFYGFLSPKFTQKTGLTSAAVREFIAALDGETEVVLLSPSIHNSAYYLNVFEHGDAEHPGLKSVAKRLFERLGLPSDLDSLVSDSRNTVFSNYVIAKPRFWRAWLGINEKMFAIAETASDPLGDALRAPTRYRGGAAVQMKVFIMERMATWLLTHDASFAVRVRDPFAARARRYKVPVAVVCDALKICYATQGLARYHDVFLTVSRIRRWLNFQTRLAAAMGLGRASDDR